MLTEKNCREFIDLLSSKEPVPGGGGASALVGAIGMALGSMVGNLTLGKKKYEMYQEDIKNILQKAKKLQDELILLVDKDAEVFEPLSKAYGLPRNTEEEKAKRDEVMEKALKAAGEVPLEIMKKSLEAINLHEELSVKGTKIAISDVGVGVAFCKSALLGASLNVYINTKLMKNREIAEKLNKEAEELLKAGIEKADKIYSSIETQLKG